MKYAKRSASAVLAALLAAGLLGGCPNTTSNLEYIAGGTGDTTVLSDTPSVAVLTPVSDLSIAGGTQVEVNWQAFARTRTSVIDVIIDEDEDPNNANETVAYANLALTTTSALVDTTTLQQGTYNIGVVLLEVGEIVAYAYAPGQVTIDERPVLYFTVLADQEGLSARGSLAFDRTEAINPRFTVSWNLSDPDSTDTVDIYLDPDDQPNGNEVLLYHSTSQTGDAFSFDLPTMQFEPGVYRFLAIVSDGANSFPFYAPGTIRLRARLAGFYDLRDMASGNAGVEGVIFEGFNPRDNAGSFVKSIGDIDGDGFDDFIIVAQFGKPRYQYNLQRTGAGEAYLVYGRAKRFSGSISLNSTGTLFRGEIYTGVPEVPDPIRPSRGITSFALLSDWDSDGVREMAFGIPFTDSAGIGAFTFGPGLDDIAPLDANGYFRTGAVVIAAGSSLRPDLGFPGRNVFNLAEFGTLAHIPLSCGPCFAEGACPCVEGFVGPKAPPAPGGCPGTYFHQHLAGVAGTPNTGSVRLGCRFSSAGFGDQFGETISAWDFDSIIMSAPNRDPEVSAFAAPSVPGGGVISVYFNDVKDGFYPWCNDQAPPANTAFNYPGSVQSAGDRLIPHGGPYHYIMDDIFLSPGYTVDPGDSDPCERVIDVHIATPDRSLRFWSTAVGARLSNAVGLGDVSGDGLLDLAIGAPQANDGAGACYLIFGRIRELVWSGELQLEELGLPMNSSSQATQRLFDGVQILGSAGERLGQSQDNARDFNGDGFSDLVIGSPLLNNGTGGAMVFFGSREVINLTQDEIRYTDVPARGLGVIFVGEEAGDLAGARVCGVDDVDRDGNADILIAAPNRSVRLDADYDGYHEVDRQGCGVVYLIYGSPDLTSQQSVQDDGTLTDPGVLLLRDVGQENLPGAVFIGRNSGDYLGAGLGEGGDRAIGIGPAGDVDGDGRGDLVFGSVRASPRDRARAGEVYLLYGTGD